MALYRPSIAVTSLIVAIGALAACSGFKKVPDACSVTIAPRDLTVPVNSSSTVVGTAFDCNGNSIANAKVTFSSTNSAIASVTPQGVIIGISVGVVKVSANANGKSGEANVTVTPERVATVTLTPATVTLRRNGTQQFAVVGKNSQGVVIPGINFVWSSSNSSLAAVTSSGQVTALAPGNVTITATADGQTGSAFVTITEVLIAKCSLFPLTQSIIVGQSSTITPTLLDSANNVISLTGRTLNWTSDNTLIANVNQQGVVTGVAKGVAKITAASPENSAINCFMTETVDNPKIRTVQIQPASGQTLRLGAPRQFTVTLLDSNGVALPSTGRIISWRAVTPTVATVGVTGIVTPISVSDVGKIAVDAEGAVDTVTFKVTKIPVQSVTVLPGSFSVTQGMSKQFTTTVTDTTGTVVSDRDITWSVSDPTKASVSATGLVSTLASGNVTVTATTPGANGQLVVGNATLTIIPVPVDTIVVNSTTVSVAKGTTTQFTITLRDAAGNELRNRNVQVSSDHPEFATGVYGSGGTTVTVNGVAVGTATLTLQTVNANGQNEGKATRVVVTVTPPPIVP
ncbi:MAG: Ig-like domain-containing protein [Gemmatimonadota bacterium]|nr:Ig-like domain-containing protein [Gemmatimonadota bacterium]